MSNTPLIYKIYIKYRLKDCTPIINMDKYSTGKIYKVINTIDDNIYILGQQHQHCIEECVTIGRKHEMIQRIQYFIHT